jgi:hypothetical protein
MEASDNVRLGVVQEAKEKKNIFCGVDLYLSVSPIARSSEPSVRA